VSTERMSKWRDRFSETHPAPVILSEFRVPVYRDEGESKDPDNVCSSMPIQGILPKDYPRNRV
jgi:hypothetical protein